MGSKYKNKQQRKKTHQPAVSQPPRTASPPASAPVQPVAGARPLPRKDQERAIWAYECARAVGEDVKEYEIAVQTFAATVLRSGLAVAVSVLERDVKRDGPKRCLVNDLSACSVPGIPVDEADSCPKGADSWPKRVRSIQVLDDYMLATRELLALITWLRRACRAVRALKESGPNAQEAVNA